MPTIYAIAAYLRARVRNDDGVTAVEYGLLVSLLAVAFVAGVSLFGSQITSAVGALVAKF
ncbi:Flp family type IVb pilin [Actinoplanes sp. CA-030573]|uniref:Flp family type IVb pilin n=1 Tax=Actinoplanes sp. CA-030573 TaxID=3239898 RepID=UPI003D8A5A6B